MNYKGVSFDPLALQFMEGSSFAEIKSELKVKFLPTYIAMTAFWMPLQAINFYYLPTKLRVIYVGFLAALEANVLCILKRTSHESFEKFVEKFKSP